MPSRSTPTRPNGAWPRAPWPAGGPRGRPGSRAGGRAAASAGISLVRGPLLADEPDPWWAEAERSRADRVVGRLYHAAAAGALAAGDATEAAMRAEGAMAA